MTDARKLALEAARKIRSSRGYSGLSADERRDLDRDMTRLTTALGDDPYAVGLDAPQNSRTPPPAPAPPPPPGTAQIGRRAADTLQAVNFPGFVASLIQGTFQAIVDATAQQVREYAALVASLSQSLDKFSAENVSPTQVRATLAQRYPSDLAIAEPPAGEPGEAKLVPLPGSEGQSPAWLAEYGLGDQELTPELTEGALLAAGRNRVGEDRMQSLATMVLMGMSRIVVEEGEIAAKMQFHAEARETTTATMLAAQSSQGVAGRSVGSSGATMMVSTMKANAQAEANIKADLMGSVRITFRTETFSLDRFADSAAIQLINRHARWQGDAVAPAAAPAPGSNGKPDKGGS